MTGGVSEVERCKKKARLMPRSTRVWQRKVMRNPLMPRYKQGMAAEGSAESAHAKVKQGMAAEGSAESAHAKVKQGMAAEGSAESAHVRYKQGGDPSSGDCILETESESSPFRDHQTGT